MRRRVIALVFVPALGCASLIGATFDDAHLGGPDAADEPADAAPDVAQEAALADADAAPFDPAAIANLAFWIDATYGVDTAGDAGAGPVTRWHDRSAFGRDAVPAGGGTNPPTLVPASLNGNAVVHFTRASLDLLQSSFSGPGGTAITIFIVTRGDPVSAVRFQSAVNTWPFFIFPIDYAALDAGTRNLRLLNGTNQPTSLDLATGLDGGASVATVRWRADGTASTFHGGALVEQRIAQDPAIPSGQTLFLGGALPLLAQPQTLIPFAEGDVAEVIVYASALDDSSRVEVEAYLSAKWGLGP